MKTPWQLWHVEDNEPDIFLLQLVLHRLSIQVIPTTFRDGHTALEKIREAATGGHVPQLLMIDLYLPKVAGAAILRFAQQHPAMNSCHIAVTSSLPHPPAEFTLRNQDTYIVKTGDLTRYEADIRAWLGRYPPGQT